METTLPSWRRWENAHIALWLAKDTCWLLNIRPVALFMAVPTITLAVLIAWRLRSNRTELAHNLAVVLWICGNVVWMVGEFYHDDTWRPYAQWFFFAGLAIILSYYAFRLVARGRAKWSA